MSEKVLRTLRISVSSRVVVLNQVKFYLPGDIFGREC